MFCSDKLSSLLLGSLLLIISLYNPIPLVAQGSDDTLPELPNVETLLSDSLIQMILIQSPVLQAQKVDIKQKTEAVSMAKKGWWSSFRMGINFLNVAQDFENQTTTVGFLPSLGVNIQVDFERLLKTPNTIRDAKLAKQKARYMLANQQQELHIKIAGLINTLHLSVDRSKARRISYETIRNQLVLIEERFSRGETEFATYLNALNAVNQARESYLETYYAAVSAYQQIQLFLLTDEVTS